MRRSADTVLDNIVRRWHLSGKAGMVTLWPQQRVRVCVCVCVCVHTYRSLVCYLLCQVIPFEMLQILDHPQIVIVRAATPVTHTHTHL